MLEALEMWCWRKMQRISWTDRRSNEDILRTIDKKRTLIDIRHHKKKEMQIIGHTLRHGDELHSIIIEGMIEDTRSRGRPRTRYISH
ncbi:HTH CENPB-type domain-containing protein [Aphis craccivora]|uniref:HTH CENPB-type domain-containing protein n=1 Tax=Aphis craccivora TaxID=307492 RepID=A0A6G0Z1K8_APHCR|nr:HTH CENPB-type domain-containing protein [Aphis craccivora]